MQHQRTIFQCHHAAWEDEYWSVMQASHVMVNSSHNLAAFMARYQGVDWRNTKNWDCNSRWGRAGLPASAAALVVHHPHKPGSEHLQGLVQGLGLQPDGALFSPPRGGGSAKHRVRNPGGRLMLFLVSSGR